MIHSSGRDWPGWVTDRSNRSRIRMYSFLCRGDPRSLRMRIRTSPCPTRANRRSAQSIAKSGCVDARSCVSFIGLPRRIPLTWLIASLAKATSTPHLFCAGLIGNGYSIIAVFRNSEGGRLVRIRVRYIALSLSACSCKSGGFTFFFSRLLAKAFAGH